MGFWDDLLYDFVASKTKTKPKNFDKYKAEIEKTKTYIKSKRRAFYKKNKNLKER